MAHLGFSKLKAMLAAKGAKNPGAVAASIGTKKYGEAKMEHAAHTGKPLEEKDKLKKK